MIIDPSAPDQHGLTVPNLEVHRLRPGPACINLLRIVNVGVNFLLSEANILLSMVLYPSAQA